MSTSPPKNTAEGRHTTAEGELTKAFSPTILKPEDVILQRLEELGYAIPVHYYVRKSHEAHKGPPRPI